MDNLEEYNLSVLANSVFLYIKCEVMSQVITSYWYGSDCYEDFRRLSGHVELFSQTPVC